MYVTPPSPVTDTLHLSCGRSCPSWKIAESLPYQMTLQLLISADINGCSPDRLTAAGTELSGSCFLMAVLHGDLRRGASVSERVFASKILAVGRDAFTFMCTCVCLGTYAHVCACTGKPEVRPQYCSPKAIHCVFLWHRFFTRPRAC